MLELEVTPLADPQLEEMFPCFCVDLPSHHELEQSQNVRKRVLCLGMAAGMGGEGPVAHMGLVAAVGCHGCLHQGQGRKVGGKAGEVQASTKRGTVLRSAHWELFVRVFARIKD